MGVTGLWKLIEPCGKPVPVESLEGKILAVDVSIWLHQVVKGFQDNKGSALNNAHLLGLFHRLCKLMYFRVKPVFVFDGCVPQLKRDTIARRQQQRSKLSNEADRIQNLLLQSLAKEKVVQQALGTNAELLLKSPLKKKTQNKDDSLDDMFKLPDLPASVKKGDKGEEMDDLNESFSDSFCSTEDATASGSTDDSSYDESNPRNAYNTNILAIDVRANDFKQLPADVRHEILVDIKETRKQSSWGRLHELPSRSDDFSTFQMKRLLKRRDVQVCLEEAEKEMGNDHALTYSELTNIFTEEGILESETLAKATKQISSSENTRFLLVRDLKKKLQKVDKIEERQEEKETDLPTTEKHEDNNPSSSKSYLKSESPPENKKSDREYEADLELAIALSLQENEKVYDEKDYDYDSDEVIKLNKDQRRQLQNAAKGPARSYMIEYAGMNEEEVQGIMDKTQVNENDDEIVDRLIGDIEKKEKLKSQDNLQSNESQEIHLHVSDDSDSTDSDLEEVVEHTTAPGISITVDVTNKLPVDDDLFADVFNDSQPTQEDECVIQETPEVMESNSAPLNENTIKTSIKTEDMCKEDVKIYCKNMAKTAEITKDYDECVIKETPPIFEKEEKPNIQTNPCKKEDILSILNDLKQQADDIKNIKLDNIKLNDSIIEISDDELSQRILAKEEIIEICDSDGNERASTPPPDSTTSHSAKLKSLGKSPELKTPSKSPSITSFFNVDYVIKRTPDKPKIEEKDGTPKVKSPFFIKKTPKSANKSGSNSPSSNKKMSKASKTLFEPINDNPNVDSMDDGIETLKPAAISEEDVIKEAAELLKSNKTTEELNDMANILAKDRLDLEKERNRQDRMSMSVTQRMNSDCQELLRLFGVPYIVAPMEAEAQCAFLDIIQLTNGTITDDSDIWLFGGRTVYKNFFAQNKNVMEFRSEQIEKNFNCNRQKLIQLACLVGSDYTTGIHGIGAVTAMEILASFGHKDNSNKSDDASISNIQSIVSTLQNFRNWWQSFKASANPPGSSARLALQKKLKNIELHEGFPNTAVVEAYLFPKVDENKEPLSWGYPDVESLREFAKKTFGWTTNKTDDILMPVIKKLNEKRTQQSIRNYFNVKSALNLRQIKVSKRVQNAIDKMTGNGDSDNTPEQPTKAKRSRLTKRTATKKGSAKLPTTVEGNPTNEVNIIANTGTSIEIARGPMKRAAKAVNLPSSKEVIPQREKTLVQMEANKKLAAEILKTTAKDAKKKRKA